MVNIKRIPKIIPIIPIPAEFLIPKKFSDLFGGAFFSSGLLNFFWFSGCFLSSSFSLRGFSSSFPASFSFLFSSFRDIRLVCRSMEFSTKILTGQVPSELQRSRRLLRWSIELRIVIILILFLPVALASILSFKSRPNSASRPVRTSMDSVAANSSRRCFPEDIEILITMSDGLILVLP